jgi:hypothetical protein
MADRACPEGTRVMAELASGPFGVIFDGLTMSASVRFVPVSNQTADIAGGPVRARRGIVQGSRGELHDP